MSNCKPVSRGKRRSSSQAIGEIGESLFAAWAVKNGLTATKASADYGLDFFCEVFEEIEHGAEEAFGSVLGVQVKSTAADRSPSIALDRTDAVNFLRQQQATCLIGIAINQEEIHFRFRDEQFIDCLLEFLAKNREKLKLKLSDMHTDTKRFRRDLANAVKPSTLNRLKVYHAERTSRLTVPGAEVVLNQTSRGGSAEIRAPWIGNAFLVHPEMRQRVRAEFFGLGNAPDVPAPGIFLHPYLQPVLELADTEVIVRGGIEGETVVRVCNGTDTAEATFKLRQFGDEWALTHPTGLCLIWSDWRLRPDGSKKFDMYVHLARGTMSLGSLGQDRKFFELLKPGSKLIRHDQYTLEIDSCGKALSRIGPKLKTVEHVFHTLGLDLSSLYLYDWAGTEFAASLYYLESLLTTKHTPEELFPAFVFNVPLDVQISSLEKRTFSATIPLILNINTNGMVVWLAVSGKIFLDGAGKLCGMAIGELHGWRAESRPRFTKSQYPELSLFENVEGIPLGLPRKKDEEFITGERVEKTEPFMRDLVVA